MRKAADAHPAEVSPLEIERKFLLKRLPANLSSYPHQRIEQGYLATEKRGVQVRLRKQGAVCTLTCKRPAKTGREEREIVLTRRQFEALWPATEGRRLVKVRYEIPWRGRTIELDVYQERHGGLVVAEVEFPNRKSCFAFKAPAWFGDDVTEESRYSNVVLASK